MHQSFVSTGQTWHGNSKGFVLLYAKPRMYLYIFIDKSLQEKKKKKKKKNRSVKLAVTVTAAKVVKLAAIVTAEKVVKLATIATANSEHFLSSIFYFSITSQAYPKTVRTLQTELFYHTYYLSYGRKSHYFCCQQ